MRAPPGGGRAVPGRCAPRPGRPRPTPAGAPRRRGRGRRSAALRRRGGRAGPASPPRSSVPPTSARAVCQRSRPAARRATSCRCPVPPPPSPARLGRRAPRRRRPAAWRTPAPAPRTCGDRRSSAAGCAASAWSPDDSEPCGGRPSDRLRPFHSGVDGDPLRPQVIVWGRRGPEHHQSRWERAAAGWRSARPSGTIELPFAGSGRIPRAAGGYQRGGAGRP